MKKILVTGFIAAVPALLSACTYNKGPDWMNDAPVYQTLLQRNPVHQPVWAEDYARQDKEKDTYQR